MSIADISANHAGHGLRPFSGREVMPDRAPRDIGLTRDGIDEALRDVASNRRRSL